MAPIYSTLSTHAVMPEPPAGRAGRELEWIAVYLVPAGEDTGAGLDLSRTECIPRESRAFDAQPVSVAVPLCPGPLVRIYALCDLAVWYAFCDISGASYNKLGGYVCIWIMLPGDGSLVVAVSDMEDQAAAFDGSVRQFAWSPIPIT